MSAPPPTSARLAGALTAVLVSGALLAFVLALVGVDRPGAHRVAAAAITVAVAFGAALRVVRRGEEPLGAALTVRGAAAVAAAGQFASAATVTSLTLTVLCLLVLLGAALAEPLLLRLQNQPVPFVAHLPGVRPVPVLPPWGRLAFLGGLAATGLGALIGLLSAPAGWWLLLCVWAGFPTAALAYQGRQRLARARVVGRAIPHAVGRYAPEFILYTARPDDASYQVTMWLPYLRRTGRSFVIVTRDALPAALLAELADEPVISCRRPADLEAVVAGSVRAVFYVNASSGNGTLVRHSGLRHVYLGHGDSDKPPSYNPTHAMYDQIFAAGPAAVRRYAEHGVLIPAEKFTVVGRPQTEQVQLPTRDPAAVADPVVLYAPTWRGHVSETALSSLPVGEQIVAALVERGATVIFRPHPFSYEFEDDAAVIAAIQRRLADDARDTGREHLFGAEAETVRGVLDCCNASDALVSDVSSVVSDYLKSGKPFAMIAVPAPPATFVAGYPVARAAYVVPADLQGLDATLTAMLGPDPQRAQRLAVRTDYLGNVETPDYAAGFVTAVQAVLDAPRPAAAEVAEFEDGAPLVPRSRVRRLARERAYEGAATVAASAALGLALAGVAGWLALLPALLALAITGLGQRAGEAVTVGDSLGRFGPARLLVLAAAAAAVLDPVALRGEAVPTVVVPVAAGLVLFGLALVAEDVIGTAWTQPAVRAAGLPGLDVEVTERLSRGRLPLLITGLLAAACFFSALVTGPGLPAIAWVLPALLAVGAAGTVTAAALRYDARATIAEHRVTEAVAAAAPEFALYFASGVGAGYQAGMWLPWLARIGRPFIVVARTVSMFTELVATVRAAGLDVPVLYRPTLRSLEELIVPSLRAAFYVNNAVKNTHFVERRELTHVWLNHGDSEKPACFNPVHAIYDLIFAAGQAGIDRYARHGVHIPAAKFVITGRPQVADIVPATARGERPPTVLYAPTWQGPYADSRLYSLPQGTQIVQALLDRGAILIFRAHPFNYRFDEARAQVGAIGALLAADRERTGRPHRFGPAAETEWSLTDCFNASDAMISDVSATLSDYLMAAKPYAVVAVGADAGALAEQTPVAAGGVLLDADLGNLDEVLDELLDPARDRLGPERERLRRYYLGEVPVGRRYADGFLDAARAVLDRHELDRQRQVLVPTPPRPVGGTP